MLNITNSSPRLIYQKSNPVMTIIFKYQNLLIISILGTNLAFLTRWCVNTHTRTHTDSHTCVHQYLFPIYSTEIVEYHYYVTDSQSILIFKNEINGAESGGSCL